MSTPAPASLYVPRSKRRSEKRADKRVVVEAPAPSLEVDAYLLCVRVRAVGGVSADAMEQCVEKLVRSFQEKARSERLRATTIVPPAPSNITAAVLDVVDPHDHGCSCPECEPESDEHPLFVADEGHQVLSDSAGYYGVSSMGGW